MDFSHFPRLENDLVAAAHWPRPPDGKPFKSQPPFGPRNAAVKALGPSEKLVWHHSAANFIRFVQSVACDARLRVLVQFSNDEVAPDGSYICSANIATLNWDVTVYDKQYDPSAVCKGDWIVRMGKWMRLELENLQGEPTEFLRYYVRGSTL